MQETTPALRGNRCQCAACGAVFAKTVEFDRHRVGEYAGSEPGTSTRRCLSAEEMATIGFARDKNGLLRFPPTASQLASLARLRERKASNARAEADAKNLQATLCPVRLQ